MIYVVNIVSSIYNVPSTKTRFVVTRFHPKPSHRIGYFVLHNSQQIFRLFSEISKKAREEGRIRWKIARDVIRIPTNKIMVPR
jgi:hypothetical protein